MGFIEVKLFEELNLDGDVKVLLSDSNLPFVEVTFEYKFIKFVFDVCLLFIKASSPRAKSDPAEEKDSKLKVVGDSFGKNNRLAEVSVLSDVFP